MTPNVFSADDQPPHLRLDYWRTVVSETFVGLECDEAPNAPMAGSVTCAEAGNVLVSHVHTVAQTVRRTPHLIRRDGAEVFLVSVQLSGEGVISQDGREARLRPGDFALYDSTRPYALNFSDPFDQMVLHMPRSTLERRIGGARGLTARRIGAEPGAASATRAFLSALGPALAAADAQTSAQLGEAALDLAAIALSELAGGDVISLNDAAEGLRARAKAEMSFRLGDASFTTVDLAASLRVSPRRLQEVFAQAGETPMKWLWERRLSLAAERLRDPSWAGASITEIAFRSGFSDAAQFSRRFRARFEMTARAYRAG